MTAIYRNHATRALDGAPAGCRWCDAIMTPRLTHARTRCAPRTCRTRRSRPPTTQWSRQLQLADSGSLALRVGEAGAGFRAAPNAEGKLVATDELLARGPLVVSFFRGELVPLLPHHAAGLRGGAAGDHKAGRPSWSRSRPTPAARRPRPKHQHALHYEVLSDARPARSRCSSAWCSVRPMPIARCCRAAASICRSATATTAGSSRIPATFVVDRAGIVRYAFADIDFTYRAEPDAIIGALRAPWSSPWFA